MKARFSRLSLGLLFPAIILAGCVPAGPALHEAAMKDDVETIRELLKQGNNINEYWYFHTPLGSAAFADKMKAAEFLVESGADIDLTLKGLNNGIGFCEQFRNSAPADAQRCSDSYRKQIGFVKVAKVRTQLEMYSKSGQTDRAIAAMNEWLTTGNPQDEFGFSRLSGLYIQNRQYKEAIAAAKRAIELKPDLGNAYLNLGIAHQEEKRFDEAVVAYRKAIELNAKWDLPHWNLGRLHYSLGDYDKAAAEFRQASVLNPQPKYSFEVAQACYVQGRQDDAIAAADEAVERGTIRGIGITTAIEGGLPVVKEATKGLPAEQAGIQAGDVILKVDDKSTEGLKEEQFASLLNGARGTQVALTIRRGDGAETFQKQLTRGEFINTFAIPAYAQRSLAHRQKGNRERSVQDAETAIKLDPANDMARIALGAARLDRGDFKESIAALSGVKNGAHARILEATAHARLGEMKEAGAIYAAIPEEELAPRNVPLAADRAALLQLFRPTVTENREKAKALDAKGAHPEALAALTEALGIADEADAAAIREELSAVLKKAPRLAEELPEEARKHALRGELLVKDGEFGPAVAEFRKAIRIAPYAPRLHYNCAQVLAESRNYPEAIRSMKTYLQVAADAPDARKAKDDIIQWEFRMEKGQ